MNIYDLRLRLPYSEEYKREFLTRAGALAEQAAAAVAEFYGIPEKEILQDLPLYNEYIARSYIESAENI